MNSGPLVLLVAVDGSPAALRALAHALRIGEETACALHVCNVQPAMSIAGILLAGEEKLVEHFSGAPGHALIAVAREMVGGREAHFHLLNGEPAQELAALATRLGADLLLMGTRGLNPARELLLGSVARRTLALAPCPAVLVRPS